MKSKSEKEKIELKKRLARILRLPGNKICADCPETRPTWISFIKPQQNFALGSKVLASFVCLECAGLHRKLGTRICVVRSISHDQFDKKDVDSAEYSGNEVVNEIFEGHLQKSTMDGINIKPLLGAEIARRERFIRQKYVDLYFYRKRAHYQHIAEVNKMISSLRKPSKSSSFGSKSSPTKDKPSRKKLRLFLREENSIRSEKGAIPSGCSTTITNTTTTPTTISKGTATSRTRSVTERDDSHRGDDIIKSDDHRSREKKSSKKRSSKSGKTSKSRKKGKKKSSSQRRLKSKDKKEPKAGKTSNEGRTAIVGETSAPEKPPSMRKDLLLKSPTNSPTKKPISKQAEDLSGMILVFDEESSIESLTLRQRERKSLRELAQGMHSSTISASHINNPMIELSNDQNDHSDEFNKMPLVKTTSDTCDIRDTLQTSSRDVRRSRSEITMDEITRNRDPSLSPGVVGRKTVSKLTPNAMSPLQGDTAQLRAHLSKDSSDRNLKIPYLQPSPVSPTSVEGFISEETSYGFGDNTINNMSGTGDNSQTPHLDENSTVDGFKVINAPESASDRSGSGKGVSCESKGSFIKRFKNKKATDGAIKNQSGRRCNGATESENRSSRRDDYAVSLNRPNDDNEYNKSNRSIGNKSFISTSNKSFKSIMSTSNKSFKSIMSTSNKSLVSIGNRSKRSTSNKSYVSIDEPILGIEPRRQTDQEYIPCDSPPSKKKRSSTKQKKSKKSRSRSKSDKSEKLRSRSKSSKGEKLRSRSKSSKAEKSRSRSKSKSEKKLNSSRKSETKLKSPRSEPQLYSPRSPGSSRSPSGRKWNSRTQALLDEWERLKMENEKMFVYFDQSFSNHFHESFEF